MVRPSSCIVQGGTLSSRRYLLTYLPVFCRVSLRSVLCAVCVLPWCVGACCCSPLCFVLCVSWGVLLCVPCPLHAVQCCAALCWHACVVLFAWSVRILAPGAVVRRCVLCCFPWCSALRCCAVLLGAWCAVLLPAVPCCCVRRLLCGAVFCCAGAPASCPCVVLCCFSCTAQCPVVLPVVSVCSSPGLVAGCCFPSARCGVGVPGLSGRCAAFGDTLLWCFAPLRCVLWCCASVWCCAVVPGRPFLSAVCVCLLWPRHALAACQCFSVASTRETHG